MIIGVSSYSYFQAVKAGRMDQYQVVDQAAKMGFTSMDFSVLLLDGETPLQAAPKLRQRAKDAGIVVQNYAVGADFLANGIETTVATLKKELDVAAELGAKTFRHDASAGFRKDSKQLVPFYDALPEIAEGYRLVTEYAATLGILTMVENHGYYCQDSERVHALIRMVAHKNFGALLDIGNFVCADENPIHAVARLAPYAFHVHAKDFHMKPSVTKSPGIGWFPTRSGSMLRGAIIGHGDVPVAQCISMVKAAGYDGVVAIEFEGIEDCLLAIEDGKKNLEQWI